VLLIYLSLSAVVILFSTLVLQRWGEAPVAIAHLLFVGGVAPLIFAAIAHFVPVLTRGRQAHGSVRWTPLLLQLAGVTAFLGFSTGSASLTTFALVAVGVLLVALNFAAWLLVRARNTLGSPHPCWLWYLAAVVLLCLGLTLVPAMVWWPGLRHELRLVHLHLNILGFIGLTALGTLQVLLPTALGEPDSGAAARLRRGWPRAAAAVLAIAVGAAVWLPLALAGALLLGAVTLEIGVAWARQYGWPTLTRDGAAVSLCAALAAFFVLLVCGAVHGLRLLDPASAAIAFAVGFLMPLVTGALSQLLPVWCYPGQRNAPRERLRVALTSAGAVRALFFVCAGVLLAFGVDWAGLALAAAGMLLFLISLLRGRAS